MTEKERSILISDRMLFLAALKPEEREGKNFCTIEDLIDCCEKQNILVNVLDSLAERESAKENLQIIRTILDKGVSFSKNAYLMRLKKALVMEAAIGKFDILLRIEKLDVNFPGPGRNTLLHYAFLHKNIEAIEYLLKNGADLKAQNLQKQVPAEMLDKTSLENILKANITIRDLVNKNNFVLSETNLSILTSSSSCNRSESGSSKELFL